MKKIVCLLLSTLMLVSSFAFSSFASGTYTDVPDSKWYTEAINFCVDNHYMDPVDDITFGKADHLTRGETAYILSALSGFPTEMPDDPCYDDDEVEFAFDDIVRWHKYSDAIRWSEEYGILSGCGNRLFRPEWEISRQQFACALYNYAQYKGYDTSADDVLSTFSDASNVSSYAKDALNYCISKGFMSGQGNGKTAYLVPKWAITRAEAASMIQRFVELVMKQEIKSTQVAKYVLDGGSGSGTGDSFVLYDTMVELSGKDVPNFLYIGLAMEDPTGDYQWNKRVVEGEEYHCVADILSEEDIKDFDLAKEKIEKADIIFVAGGNTVRLVKLLKDYNIDMLIHKAQSQPKVFAGSSAGAICFSECGESQTQYGYWRVDGVGGVYTLMCPHALTDSGRYDLIEGEITKTPYMSCVAVDGAALVVDGNQYKALIYKTGYMANLCKMVDGVYTVTPLSTTWAPLSDITG